MEHSWTYTVTGYGFVGKSLTEVAETCAAAGIRGIEGAPPLVERPEEAWAARAAEQFRAAGLSIPTFHLPFEGQQDVAAFYRTSRQAAVEELKRWIVAAAALGAEVAILHPTTSLCSPDVEGLDPFVAALGESLRVLLPFAAEHRIILALENMLPREKSRFCGLPEHIAVVRREFADPSLGFCLDTGHALIAGGPDNEHRFFEVMEQNLVAFHLSDSAGDRDMHIAPGRGLVNWSRLFGAAARIGFARPMCIETTPFAHAAYGTFPVEAWRELVAGTERLARGVLGARSCHGSASLL